MTGGQGFQLHPLAAQDVNDIWEFVAAGSLTAAKRVREEILEAIQELVTFPHQGHVRADLTSRPLRFQRVRDYLIAYVPDRRPLLVIAVMHGRRNPRAMTAVLRGRR